MKKIEKISLSHARNGEHYDFMAAAIGIFGPTRAPTLHLSAYYDAFKKTFDEEDMAIKIIRSSASTTAIQQLDNERYDIFLFIYQTADLSIRLPNTAIKQAATKLQGLMKTYKGLHTRTQRDESGLAKNLIEDLKSSAYAPAVAKLNLTDKVLLLEEKNNLFIEHYMARADELEEKAVTQKMTSLRPRIDEAYNNAMEMINSVYAANEVASPPNPEIRLLCETIVPALQANVMQMKLIMDARRNRGVKKKRKVEEEKETSIHYIP